jgi:HEAT repeat protein
MGKDEKPKFPSKIDDIDMDEWIKRLSSPDPSMRATAVRVVPLFGPEAAKKALDKMVNMMTGDPDISVRTSALMACTTNPYDDPAFLNKVAGKLYALLSTPQISVRMQAVLACQRMGVFLAPIAEKHGLITMLCSENVLKNVGSYELRTAGAMALGQIAFDDKKGGPNPTALSALINILGDPAYSVRLEALQSIMVLGSPKADLFAAKKEIEFLLDRITKEQDKILNMWLHVCLMRLDKNNITDTNVREIGKHLKDSDQHVRIQSAKALGCMGPAAKSQVNDLVACLRATKEDNLYLITMCIFALGQIGPDAMLARPDVQKFADHKDPVVKEQVKTALEQIDAKPKKP